MSWNKLIEEKRNYLKMAIEESWKEMLTVEHSISMRNVVLLWDDGDITRHYRDQNSFSKGEFDGSAICIASFGGQLDEEVFSEFLEEYGADEAEEAYKTFYVSEYPVSSEEKIELALDHLEQLRM